MYPGIQTRHRIGIYLYLDQSTKFTGFNTVGNSRTAVLSVSIKVTWAVINTNDSAPQPRYLLDKEVKYHMMGKFITAKMTENGRRNH